MHLLGPVFRCGLINSLVRIRSRFITNIRANIHCVDATCHPEQWCCSVMRFNSFWTVKLHFRGITHIRLWPHSFYLLSGLLIRKETFLLNLYFKNKVTTVECFISEVSLTSLNVLYTTVMWPYPLNIIFQCSALIVDWCLTINISSCIPKYIFKCICFIFIVLK